MILEAGAIGFGIGAAAAKALHRRRSGAAAAGEPAGADPIVAPAYERLVSAPVEVRQALLDAGAALSLAPGALATVIESESGWRADVPEKKIGTPRAGLIQITVGARLPGLGNAEAVWAVRDWPADRQLREIVVPFFERFKSRSPGWSALDIYKRTFLPADVGKPHDFKVGEKGSTEPVAPGLSLTRGQIYDANPGFDRQKRGYFTWDDVAARVNEVEAHAKGKLVTLSGKIVDEKGPEGLPPPTKSPSPAGTPAPALLALRALVDARWPGRSKASDGIMGDAAHAARASDHNQGNALDITSDPAKGPNLDALAAALLADPRVTYVIWNRRIANRAIEGGAWRPYTGANPHTRHLHVSIRPEAREDVRQWQLGEGIVPPPQTASTGALPRLLTAWSQGLVDNVWPAVIEVEGYVLRVASDALSVGGVRVPVTFREVLDFCAIAPFVPSTKRIVDARWAEADRRLVVAPMTVSGKTDEQAREWSKRIGPPSPELTAGPWKEWITNGVGNPGQAVNYGFVKNASGAVWQSPGTKHDWNYRDYSQLFAPTFREAIAPNGDEVDLLDELAKGCPLGGPLPPWMVDKLAGQSTQALVLPDGFEEALGRLRVSG